MDPSPPRIHIELYLKNLGKTPAMHVSLNTSWEITTKTIGQGAFFGDTLDIYLAPGQIHIVDLWIGLKPGQSTDSLANTIRGLQAGDGALKVSGEIKYIDIFQIIHRTQYCGTYDSRVGGLGYYGGGVRSMD
jgi:hypothetical protein